MYRTCRPPIAKELYEVPPGRGEQEVVGVQHATGVQAQEGLGRRLW